MNRFGMFVMKIQDNKDRKGEIRVLGDSFAPLVEQSFF